MLKDPGSPAFCVSLTAPQVSSVNDLPSGMTSGGVGTRLLLTLTGLLAPFFFSLPALFPLLSRLILFSLAAQRDCRIILLDESVTSRVFYLPPPPIQQSIYLAVPRLAAEFKLGLTLSPTYPSFLYHSFLSYLYVPPP